MIRIGDKLKEEREKKGYSLEDVAIATKIRPEFLKAIEAGNYKKLPSSAYAHGFVKNYIDYLGLPQKTYLALFRREFDEQEYRKVLPENISTGKEISVNRLRIRQAAILGIMLLVGLFAYIFLQYRQAFFSPSLSVSSPTENVVLTGSAVNVKGNTEANASVTINQIPVVVDANGNFQKVLPVFSGNILITVVSTNTFGKVSTIVRHVTVR